jgi:phage gpG-like protein
VKLEFEVKAAAVERALKDIASAEKVRKALGAVGRVVKSKIQLGFRASTSPYGEPWKPPVLRNGAPLVDTGALRSSISYRVEADRVVIGTNLKYAPVHQFGATILPKRKKYLAVPVGGSAGGAAPTAMILLRKAVIPARRFMPINNGQVELPPAWANSALNAMAKALEL